MPVTRRFLDPRSDLVFKRIFGEHPDILRSLLNAVLPLPGGPIVSLEYLPAELAPAVPLFKYTVVDVRCKDSSGRQFVVEMQMDWTRAFLQRCLFNASKAYVSQLGKNEDFRSLLPVMALGLLDDTYRPEESGWYHHYQVVNVLDTRERIEGLELVFIELPKFAKADLSGVPPAQAAWLRFLRETGDLKLVRGTQTEDERLVPEITQALDLAEEGAFTDGERYHYDLYWDQVRRERTLFGEGRDEGLEAGREEGREEAREATLRVALEAMRNFGIPEADARKALGITEASEPPVQT